MDKNFFQRTLTGAIFVIVVVSALVFSAWSMFALFLFIAILGLNEFYKLAEKTSAHPQKLYGISLGIFIVVVAFLSKAFPLPNEIHFLVPLVFLPFFIELFRKKENPFSNIAWTFLGIIYIAVPMCMIVGTFTPEFLLMSFLNPHAEFLPAYAGIKYNYPPLLTFIILIWVNDTMAYLCGKFLGRHKLFERISPKKTWEGFIGGMIFTIVAGGMIANWFIGNPHNYRHEILWILMGFTISITGVLGDLAESLFKRSIGIKDSGNIFPGHGGILDRFDALFLATPFAMAVYWLCDAFLNTGTFYFPH
ncbi:MAG: phosphatidate cytidylyltransferase [Bacteroidetes bacterium]|nr:phosphatidate cytidylyltransferase [Bacteroidota bacterium]